MARQETKALLVWLGEDIRSLLDGKFVDGGGVKFFTGRERCGWKIRMIRRIREVLRLQAHCKTGFVDFASLAGRGGAQKVAGVDLDSRLSGPGFHDTASRGFIKNSCQTRHGFHAGIQYPVVIVAVTKFQLFVILVDARANGGGLPEIKRRTGNRTELTCWDHSRVNRSEAAGL